MRRHGEVKGPNRVEGEAKNVFGMGKVLLNEEGTCKVEEVVEVSSLVERGTDEFEEDEVVEMHGREGETIEVGEDLEEQLGRKTGEERSIVLRRDLAIHTVYVGVEGD